MKTTISDEAFQRLQKDVDELKMKLSTVCHPDGLISEDELRAKLGNIHPSTLWRYRKKGILKPISVGGKRMYRVSQLDNFKANQNESA